MYISSGVALSGGGAFLCEKQSPGRGSDAGILIYRLPADIRVITVSYSTRVYSAVQPVGVAKDGSRFLRALDESFLFIDSCEFFLDVV